jgi:hypothetical protein
MNVRRAVAPVLCLLAIASCSVLPALSQHRVDPLNMYERVLIIVPMTGQGTPVDPIRPKYMPLTSEMDRAGLTGFMGFVATMSDDGKFALVELVARDRTLFATILADTTIQAFLKGRDKRSDAEAAFQKLKKGFSIDHFGVIVR